MQKKIILSITLCLSLYFVSNAQCELCERDKNDLTYCYNNENFKDYCALFTDGSASFLLSKGKKVRTINLTSKATLSDFITLASDKKNKISATDILFIQEAINEWKIKRWNIGHSYTASGLGIKTFVKGTGAVAKKGQKATVHYAGFLEDGTKFDSSIDRGEPITITVGVGRVIKAWDEALQELPVGTKALIKVPSELGYGKRGAGNAIPPNATLFFEIEILEVN